MSSEIDLTDRAVYQHWHQEKLRFSDTDMIGHINNVAFAAVIESGRVAFTHGGAISDLPKGMLLVMRRIELDYRAELHWPGEVDVGSRLLRIGQSSLAIGNGLFNGDLCAATSVTILVAIDRMTRRPTPIPDQTRANLQTYLQGA